MARPLIGRTVRRLRIERGLTQQALALRLGISASYLNLIEHDQRAVTASLLISRLQSYRRQNALTRALQEYGRLVKTIFILRYLESEQLRRRINAQLNKGEALHSLREFLFFAHRGKIRRKQEEEQVHQALCLNLLTNAVIAWNTVYMAAALDRLRIDGHPVQESDLAHLSPCRYEHINPYGKYAFEVSEDLRGAKLRPLRAGRPRA